MMHKDLATALDEAGAQILAPASNADPCIAKGHFITECRAADGSLRWRDATDNLWTTVGKNDLLQNYFLGVSYTAAWYMGLKSTGSPAATDTMSSHPNWTEIIAYTAATRPVVAFGTPSAGSISNGTSRALFTITVDNTVIGGAFLSPNNVIGGTAGLLFNAINFAAPRTALAGDTVSIQVTLSLA